MTPLNQSKHSFKHVEPLVIWSVFVITAPFPFFIFIAWGWVPLLVPFALSISTIFSSEVTIGERIIGITFAILSLIPLVLSYFVIHVICLKKRTRLLFAIISTVILSSFFFKIYSVTIITGNSQNWNLHGMAIETAKTIKWDSFLSIVTYVLFGYVVTYSIRRIRKRLMQNS